MRPRLAPVEHHEDWHSPAVDTWRRLLDAELDDRARPRGIWTPGRYRRNDMVLDSGWMMVAKRDTEERPAPQPIGQPFWVSGLGDTPGWNTQNATTSIILSGQRYTWNVVGYVVGARAWIPDTSQQYQMLLIRDPAGIPIQWWGERFTPGSTGWRTVNVERHLVESGQVADFFLVAREGSATFSSFTGFYTYKRTNGNPSSGEIWHQSSGGGNEMRVHHDDKNSVDLELQLESLAVGDTISGGGIDWDITSTDHQGSHVRFGVTPATRAQEGDYTFTFESIDPATLNYVQIANHYLSVPSVQGLLSTDQTPPGLITPDENAYGVDLQVQEAVLPEDWQAYAFTSAAST